MISRKWINFKLIVNWYFKLLVKTNIIQDGTYFKEIHYKFIFRIDPYIFDTFYRFCNYFQSWIKIGIFTTLYIF